jgi:cation transport ATPase
VSHLDELLARPRDQRIREYKYRLAQTLVFGLPVIFLQYVGPSLGGVEAERWVAILQAVLTGWITYVGAAGMAFEGALLLWRRRPTLELLVAFAAVAMFLASLASLLVLLFTGEPWFRPLLFHGVVIVLAAWCGGRLVRLRKLA